MAFDPKSLRFLCLALGIVAIAGCSQTTTRPRIPTQPSTASFQGIGDLPGGAIHSEALAISDDGGVVIGRSSSARFTEEGFFTLGDSLIPLLGPGNTPVSSEPRALTPTGADTSC